MDLAYGSHAKHDLVETSRPYGHRLGYPYPPGQAVHQKAVLGKRRPWQLNPSPDYEIDLNADHQQKQGRTHPS